MLKVSYRPDREKNCQNCGDPKKLDFNGEEKSSLFFIFIVIKRYTIISGIALQKKSTNTSVTPALN